MSVENDMTEAKRDATEYIYMRSGKVIYPGELRADDVVLSDIAFGLSRIFRFNGQSKISVLRHSLAIANRLTNESKRVQLLALFHDAAEAYMMDVPVPLKPFVNDDWHLAYMQAELTILSKYGLCPTPEERLIVTRMDKELVCYEMSACLHEDCMRDPNSMMRYPLTSSGEVYPLAYHSYAADHDLIGIFVDKYFSLL